MNQINWGNNGLNNPYSYVPQIQMPAPQMEVIRVSGENGVDAFRMGPNSSVLLLDGLLQQMERATKQKLRMIFLYTQKNHLRKLKAWKIV